MLLLRFNYKLNHVNNARCSLSPIVTISWINIINKYTQINWHYNEHLPKFLWRLKYFEMFKINLFWRYSISYDVKSRRAVRVTSKLGNFRVENFKGTCGVEYMKDWKFIGILLTRMVSLASNILSLPKKKIL